jgi:hypothetical protein
MEPGFIIALHLTEHVCFILLNTESILVVYYINHLLLEYNVYFKSTLDCFGLFGGNSGSGSSRLSTPGG